MKLNIAHKIFSVALIVLAAMVSVAAYSIHLTSEISSELTFIAEKQLPLNDIIAEINVRILEKELLLERVFLEPEEVTAYAEKIEALAKVIREDFVRADELIALELADKNAPTDIADFQIAMTRFEEKYLKYDRQITEVFDLIKKTGAGSVTTELKNIYKVQDSLDRQIEILRLRVEGNSEGAVKRAEEHEKFLLLFNITMTILASLWAILISGWVTQVLVRNIRKVSEAAVEVEKGVLDVNVDVTTRDEVGRLSNSFNQMVEGLRLKERIKDTFGKYVDPRIVERLLDEPGLSDLDGNYQEMTILFVDLQGYTSISEKLQPSDLVRLLNLFLEGMTEAVSAHNGVINDFQGDAVMSFWGPPFVKGEQHAILASKAALEMIDNFEKFKRKIIADFDLDTKTMPLNMRVGISTGMVIVGNIGSSASRKFSVVGDPVNLGARLEGVNKAYGSRVILSERTFELLDDSVFAREIDSIQVKGKTKPSRIYQLLGQKDADKGFSEGLAAYRMQDWVLAEKCFKKCLDLNSEDTVAKTFLGRIKYLNDNPVDSDWDGVWKFETK